ncbi:nuclear transport factor 2 family protein [Hydrogenophaga sp.]|uniref:nuclear transport factor 2 family protein n=1 Tax=Hydrogenophaga sp. TaxID=1904254 RepID=UPI003569FBD4
MKYWFSDLYAQIDAMNLEGFIAGLTPDVQVVVANNPPMVGHEAAKGGIGYLFSSIGGIRHHVQRVVEANGQTCLEAKVEYLRKDGQTVTVPAVTMLERQGDLVSSLRIYVDIAPVYA